MCLLPIYMQFLFNFLWYVMCITLGMSTSGVKRGAIFNLQAEWICTCWISFAHLLHDTIKIMHFFFFFLKKKLFYSIH